MTKTTFQEQLANWLNEYSDERFVFKTFKEFILESPPWDKKDCTFDQEELQKMLGNEYFLDQFSWSGVQDYRALVNKGDKDSNKFIILTNDLSEVILGHCDDGMFKILSILNHRQARTYKNIGTVVEVTKVNTHSKWRRKRFASAIYKSILFEGTRIMLDGVQYKGAVKIWKSFIGTGEEKEWKSMINDKKIKVSLYDKTNSKVIKDDVTGLSDEEIWYDCTSKSEYRLIAEWK